MPWIDDEMKAAIAARLKDVHDMEIPFVDMHVSLGPDATRETLTVQLADSMAEIELRRRAGTLVDEPPMTGRPRMSRAQLIADIDADV